MMKSEFIQKAVVDRCSAVALPLNIVIQLAADSGDPTQKGMCWVLGLDIRTLAVLRPRDWIKMAGQTCSVSYREILTSEALVKILISAEVPEGLVANMLHFVDEAPLQIVVMAVEQTSQRTRVPLATIWKSIETFAVRFGAHRQVWT
jgi:hypothetical protein